jgi:hypothetical protein
MILGDPGVVEDGFIALDAHLRAGCAGLVDLLGAASDGTLVLIEIEREGEEEMLRRGLARQGWVTAERLFLSRLYGVGRVDPFRAPRLVLVARRFTDGFLDKLDTLSVQTMALLYRILVARGEPALYLEPAREPEDLAALLEPRPDAPEHDPAGADPVPGMEPVAPERLSPEELEAFYAFEARREQPRKEAGRG